MPTSYIDLPLIYFISLVVIVFLLFFSLVFLILFLYIQGNREKAARETALIKEEAYKKAVALLEDSRNKSLKIISESNQKAQDILNQIKVFDESTKGTFEEKFKLITDTQFKDLHNISSSLLDNYKEQVKVEEEKNLTSLEDTTKAIKTELLSSVADFKDVLHKETVESEQEVSNKIKQEYDKIEQELLSYKDKKLKNINDNMYEILVNATMTILGKTMNFEEHQDLVLKTLEEVVREVSIDNE